MSNIFYSIYLIFQKNRILSLLILLLFLGGLSFLATKIKFEEDITKLIPTDSKTSDIQEVLKTVNFADKIIINIQRQPDGSIDDLTKYANQFIDSVTKNSNNYIKEIQGKIQDDDINNTLNFVYQNLPLFLDDNDYKNIRTKINKDSIEAITNQNYKTLVSPTGIIAKETILKDPLGLSFIALKKLQQLSIGDQFSIHNGFLLSKDQQSILLFISPKFKSSETSENATFVKGLYKIRDQLNTKFSQKAKSEYFGAVVIAVENATQIKRDIQFSVSIALTILIIILIFFYRNPTIPIILLIPTAIGGLLAITLLYFVRTYISAISLGIGSVLLGVTLDYSLHILTHIRNNNDAKALYRDVTAPILMSSLTTALAFLCLLFVNSQALQDLGIFAAVSVMGASIFALILIPQLYKGATNKKITNTFIDGIAVYPFHKRKWINIGLIILLVVSLFTYNKVFFNNDISKLNYKSDVIIEAEKHLDKLTNISSKSIYLAAYSKTEQEALEINDDVYDELQQLKAENKILNYSSIGALIPSEKKQKNRIEKWNQFWNDETSFSIQNHLIESGHKLGFKPNTFHQFYSLLNTNFKSLTSNDFKKITAFSIDDYISSKQDLTTITSLVKVSENNSKEIINAFKDKDQTFIIDRQHMNETFLGNLKTDFNKLIGYSLVVVLLLLLLYYKSLSLTLVSSIPIFLTWLLTIGAMGLLHIEFNIFNIIISTFIFGLGIDYSIFITNGLLKEYRTGEKALATHKTSIILSVITTILGIGALIFAKHPALYSISLVSIIGILSAIIIAFTIQPFLFKVFIGSKSKRPITLRLLIHSILSYGYYSLGGILLSIFSFTIMNIIPISKKIKMKWYHKVVSKFMKSVLMTNRWIKKKVINDHNETFKKQAVVIANHSSFLDILSIGMLHPKMIFLVSDWVYNSPVIGKVVRFAGFYPVSSGIENGLDHLKKKIEQGYSLMAFPEGTRSTSPKIKRFHKGAFYLAEQFNLDIIPILIHGNHEIVPKGSFILKNGNLTLKILERIPIEDKSFGENYARRAKNVGAYFRSEHHKLKKSVEYNTYFHRIVLEDYRYKGDNLYKTVVKDLKAHKDTYKTIIDTIGVKETIIHLSQDYGQLDFLLALDAMDRKIITYIKDEEVRRIVSHSYITNNNSHITIVKNIDKALSYEGSVLILNLNHIDLKKIETIVQNNINMVLLIKESRNLSIENIRKLDFESIYENNHLIILKKQA